MRVKEGVVRNSGWVCVAGVALIWTAGRVGGGGAGVVVIVFLRRVGEGGRPHWEGVEIDSTARTLSSALSHPPHHSPCTHAYTHTFVRSGGRGRGRQ